jgi:hypothetical protein
MMVDDFLLLNPHYIVTHDWLRFRRLVHDLSGNNPENIAPLENGQYAVFMEDVNMAVRSGELVISIFSDASGVNYVVDSNGNPVNNRFLRTTTYTYPYIDRDGVYVYGILTCTFGDGSTFANDDAHETSFWYIIKGINDLNSLKQFT